MKKNFIERLSDEQIIAFLEDNFPKKHHYSYSYTRNRKGILASMDNAVIDASSNFCLGEFGAIGFDHPSNWIEYLYRIFGKEYREAYLDEVEKVFGNMG